jgi:hypothetical protein
MRLEGRIQSNREHLLLPESSEITGNYLPAIQVQVSVCPVIFRWDRYWRHTNRIGDL